MPISAEPPPPTFHLSRLDAVEWLRSLDDGSVDLVITDPPYESLEKHRKIGTTTRLSVSRGSSNPWFEIFANERFPELFAELWRVMARHAHLYLCCDAETMFVAKPLGEAAGFRFWKPLVWDKVAIGMGYHYRARHEFVLFFEKGKRPLNDRSTPDVLTAKRIWRGYPTEKPVALMEILVGQSAAPGQLVADPFMGSGSVGVAALRRGCHFLGNDLAEASHQHATERLLAAGGAPHPGPAGLVGRQPTGGGAMIHTEDTCRS